MRTYTHGNMRAGGEAVRENKPLGSYRMDLSPYNNSDHVSRDHRIIN